MTADTDREARLEELEGKAAYLRNVLLGAIAHHEDQYEAWKGAEPLYQTGEEALASDYHRERADRLKAKLEGEDDGG